MSRLSSYEKSIRPFLSGEQMIFGRPNDKEIIDKDVEPVISILVKNWKK